VNLFFTRAGRAWLALSVAVGIVVAVYLALSLSVSDDPLLMPLDDTYIHFQYARQFATGHPLHYNAGDPATSGGTSLVYPLLLAAGYRVGFSGWSLAYWALGMGVLAFLASAWLVYRIGSDNPLLERTDGQAPYAFWMALAYAVSGPFVWAALSGMETALFLLTVLLTFDAVQRRRLWLASAAAVLMVLTRPEGLILAGLAMAAYALRWSWATGWRTRVQYALGLGLPVLAGLVQPIINHIATGSSSSSGMQAKSHLYNTGAPLDVRLETILDFLWRMWNELLRGRSPDFGAFTSPLLAEAALAGGLVGLWLAWKQRRVNVAVLALAWILALTAAVATLDTAFWQFKRYQLPVMALFFPAAAWTAGALGALLQRRSEWGLSWARWLLPALIVIPAGFTTITFARYYRDNVRVVRDQQVPMARWVSAELPDDARIGVHDVGLMGYFAEQKLYDVVGLTTPGPAPAWRQGPGAIYEHMAHSDYRPDYFAIYPDVQGLRYLEDARVFGEILATFAIDLPEHNVAAATDTQHVYAAEWSSTRAEEQVAQTTTLDYVNGFTLVDQVDVANLDSEADHDYEWWFDGVPPGFVSEVFHDPYHACGLADRAACAPTDGGRVLTGGEAFTLRTRPGEDLLLVTRVNGTQAAAPLTIYVDGEQVATRVQPAVSRRWLEFITWVPADRVTDTSLRVRIEAQGTGYRPFYHWAYQGTFEPERADAAPIATFGPDGAVRLLRADMQRDGDQLQVTLNWQGPAAGTGDGVVFVHVYDNIYEPPVAPPEGSPEGVARPKAGVLPPGNWLPGVIRDDVYTVTLPDDLPPGTYRVAIGLFDSSTGQRYPVTGDDVDANRLFIGEITIN
jgi:hypothetical protein